MLNWFGACHRAGRLTVGFDTWIESLDVAADAAALTARLRHTGAAHHAPAIIAVLAPGEYTVTWQGEIVPVVERYPGTLEIQLPQGPRVGELRITRAWTRLCHILPNGIRKSVSTLLGLESGYACVYQAVRISGDVLVETPRRGVFRGDACW